MGSLQQEFKLYRCFFRDSVINSLVLLAVTVDYPSSNDKKFNKSKTRDNMKCGPIVFLLAFICTFSEGKSCTGQRLRQFTHVHNCVNRGGKCCSTLKNGDFVTWNGERDISGCGWCWSGRAKSDLYDYIYIILPILPILLIITKIVNIW